MRTVALEREDGGVACARCHLADGFLTRLRGLLGRAGLAPAEGMLIRPAGSVHTFFMRFPIDVVFLDRELRVVAVREAVRPWRAAGAKGARDALELPAGAATAAGLVEGVRLRLGDDVRTASD
jgi:uncharacterized membrane protein (UPF0127 family)